MKLVFKLVFFSLLYFPNKLIAQNSETIKIQIRVLNDLNGSEVKNTNIKVSYTSNNSNINAIQEKKQTFYPINKGSEIKVWAESPLFYPAEVRVSTENLFDGEQVEIKLSPRPNGTAFVEVIDEVSLQPIAAKVSIDNNGNVNTQNTTADKKQLSIYFEKDGLYDFTASATGYSSAKISKNLKTNQQNEVITIALKKTAIVQKIIFKDKETKEPLENVSAILVKENSSPLPFTWNNSAGEFSARADENFTLKVKKEGYLDIEIKEKASSNTITVLLEPKSLAPFLISLTDYDTKKPIEGEVKIQSPAGQTFSLKNGSKYNPKSMGTYIFSLEKEGYGTYSQNIKSAYIQDIKEVLVEFTVKSKMKNLNIVALDATTKLPINDALIKVFNDKGNEIQGKKDKNTKSVKLNSEEKHFVEVTAKGYDDLTENAPNEEIHLVYLKKKHVEIFKELEISIVNAETKKPITNAQVKLEDSDKNPIDFLNNPSKGSLLTYKVSEDKKYTININADGFLPLNQELNTKTRNITLSLQPVQAEELIIAVKDTYLDEIISVKDVKISSKSTSNIPFKLSNKEIIFKENKDDSFIIDYKSEGYPSKKETISKSSFIKNRVELETRKEIYPIAFVIQNNLTDIQKEKAEAKMSYLNGTILKNTFKPNTKAFELESKPEETLQVEIRVPGFRTYTASSNRKLLPLFEVKVTLEPLKEEVVDVKKEEPKPIITPEKTINEPIKEVAINEPKKTEISTSQKGKKFPLDGVNFEQSKTIMLPGSEVKLNELLTFLTDHPNTIIEITGHTDRIGDERQNRRLSEFRARAVANWLFNKGIKPERIKTSGKGSSENIAGNDSEENKAQNRRIDVLVLED